MPLESEFVSQRHNHTGTSGYSALAAPVCKEIPRPCISGLSTTSCRLLRCPGEIWDRDPEIAGDAVSQHVNNHGPRLTDVHTDENAKMTDCYYETKDWRACKNEVCKGLLFSLKTRLA